MEACHLIFNIVTTATLVILQDTVPRYLPPTKITMNSNSFTPILGFSDPINFKILAQGESKTYNCNILLY